MTNMLKKVFNWSEVHLSEVTSYKIHNLEAKFWLTCELKYMFLTVTVLTFDFRPELPSSVDCTWEDRFYPKAWGHPLLRDAIVNMYNDQYGSKIEPDNVMVFAGGRCAIFTVLLFLKKNVQVRIGNAEWPAYLDIMTQAGIDWKTVQLDHSNNFHPPNSAYFDREGLNAKTRVFPVISNPGNPTGTHIYSKFYGNCLKLLQYHAILGLF